MVQHSEHIFMKFTKVMKFSVKQSFITVIPNFQEIMSGILHNSRSLLTQATPLKGIQERSQIGFLYWDKGENDDSRTEVWTPTHI